MATRAPSTDPRRRLLCIVVPVLLMGVLADQASKSWADHHAARPRMLVPGYLAAYSAQNAGIILGFGRGQAWTSTAGVLVGIACATLLIGIAYVYRVRWRGADYLASTLLLAGIFGNTADRLALGHVRDFLVIWVLPNLIFNVADLLMVVGGASLLLTRYPGRRRARPDLGLTG